MIRTFIFAVAALAIANTAQAMEILRGNDWIAASESKKLEFVSGFLDGFNAAVIESNRRKMARSAINAKRTGKKVIYGDPDYALMVLPLNPEDVVEGLTDFYGDPKNLILQWWEALTLATRSMKGENIQTELAITRDCAQELLRTGYVKCTVPTFAPIN